MKKTFKVVMLPTKMIVGNQLILQLGNNKLSISHKHCIAHYSNEVWKGQHLYIVSDEEIKEGDWYLRLIDNTITKANINSDHKHYECNKIVATTDKSLTLTPSKWWENLSEEEQIKIQKDEGIYGHDEGVTESEIKNFYNKHYNKIKLIPESFIQAYIKAYNEGKPINSMKLEI